MQSKYVLERVLEMSPHEADVWRRELMLWIDNNHPHLLQQEVIQKLNDQVSYWRQAFWELMYHKHSSYKLLLDLYHDSLKKLESRRDNGE